VAEAGFDRIQNLLDEPDVTAGILMIQNFNYLSYEEVLVATVKLSDQF
jgi:hypothetical protein